MDEEILDVEEVDDGGYPSDSSQYVDMTRTATLYSGLETLHRQKCFADVTLCAGNREIDCHKNILAISSAYFMTMLTSGMMEGQQRKIHIKEMDGQTLESLVDFIYVGEITLSTDNVQNVLSAANLFQILSLKDGCAEFMIKHLSVSNCIGVYFFAQAHQCNHLAVHAKELINSQFDMLCREQEFLFLPADKLIELINDDQINIKHEEQLYETCMAWLNYSLDERKQHIFDVFCCIRFANISSYYFCDNVDGNELLRACEPLQKVLQAVRYFHMMRNRRLEVDLNDIPRSGMPVERVIVVVANPQAEDNSQKFNCMQAVLPHSGEIKFICKLPHNLFMPGVCATGDNEIYLAGGALRKLSHNRNSFIPEGISSSVYLFDHLTRSWQVKNRMIHPRCQFSLIVVDRCLFAVGGRDEDELLDSVERYDPRLNVWSLVAPLPHKMRCMASVSYKGKLFVFGGEMSTEITNAAYCYDPLSDSWTKLPPMKSCRALSGAVVYRDKIYVIGGNSSISEKWKKEFLPEHCVISVEIFDPTNNSWSLGPDLSNALCGAGVVKYGDSIILIGGEDDRSWMAGMCTLREENSVQTWIAGVELPIVMSTFGCVVANISKKILDD